MNEPTFTEQSGYCTHVTTEPRIRTIAGGVTVVSLQCLTCGASIRHVKKDQYVLSNLKPFDQEFRDEVLRKGEAAREQKSKERREQFERDYISKTGAFWDPYLEYLKSDHWAKVRAVVLRRDPVCLRCFINSSVHAHHTTYLTHRSRSMD